MKKVFVSFKVTEEQKKRLAAISDEYEFVYEEDTDAEVVIGSYRTDRLKEFPNLKWIQVSAVGVDRFIQKGALADNVILTNAVDIHTVEVAEHLLATILMMIRKLHLYRDDQYKHLWTDEGKVKEISKLKVTIVGFGNIGKHLAKQLKALGAYVIGVKRTMIEKPEYVDELYTVDDLDKAISDVDVVAAVVPGNKANYHLFTMDTFKKMRPDCILVNAGRGTLYDEEILYEALDKGIIAGASSDVFAKEPLDPASKLWDCRNFLVTPHVAGSYHLESAAEAFIDLVVDNLQRYLHDEELLNIVTERE